MTAETRAIFTPGPWRVSDRVQDYAPQVRVMPERGRAVAFIEECDGKDAPHEERRANARLIAAAPEMYEPLRLLLDDFESVMDKTTTPILGRGKARAALAKAEER